MANTLETRLPNLVRIRRQASTVPRAVTQEQLFATTTSSSADGGSLKDTSGNILVLTQKDVLPAAVLYVVMNDGSEQDLPFGPLSRSTIDVGLGTWHHLNIYRPSVRFRLADINTIIFR